jgi:hypothetical protein
MQDCLAGLIFAVLGTVLAYVIFVRGQPHPAPAPVPVPQPEPVKPEPHKKPRPWRPGDEDLKQ